jgi:hypothetical protein
MDKLLLDMELLKDPIWRRAVRSQGIRSARGAIERGHTLAEVFPYMDDTNLRPPGALRDQIGHEVASNGDYEPRG